MLVSPDSWTVSSPSKTAVGTSTGFSNLLGMLSSSSASLKDTSAFVPAVGGDSQPGEGETPSPARRQASRLELGGREYLFFGAAIEGKLLPALAFEDGTPGSPVVFGP
jgi:hypothetical protein